MASVNIRGASKTGAHFLNHDRPCLIIRELKSHGGLGLRGIGVCLRDALLPGSSETSGLGTRNARCLLGLYQPLHSPLWSKSKRG